MDSEDEGIDDLTVAIHLDAIDYDSKNGEYEIQLSAVQLLHLDIKNDIIRLKVPSHRLQRIKTQTFNAETYAGVSKAKPSHKTHVNECIKSPKSDISDNTYEDDEYEDDDPNIDEITGIILAQHNHNHNDDDYKSDDLPHDEEEKQGMEMTPKHPRKRHQIKADIKALKKANVLREWHEIHKKSKLNKDETQTMTKDACFKRIIFILKCYTHWIAYKDKHFKSQHLPKNEDFLSITSFFIALDGYDKIALLNDFYFVLDAGGTSELSASLFSNEFILECLYCLNRLNNSSKNSELYNLNKLSMSLRRDLYFINDQNSAIAAGSVDERVEIGIQQYLDILYCSLLYPTNISDGIKYNMDIKSKKKNNFQTVDSYLFGEYFTYWKVDHLQFCRCKYPDLKSELLTNSIYKINQRDFFCLYNRSKDFLLSIMGRKFKCLRVKFGCKVKLEQKFTINHIISLLLYCNYYNSFVYSHFISRGCVRRNAKESFAEIRVRNNEIGHWCRLLNECIYCFGLVLGENNIDRLYYNINGEISLSYLSIEYNMPISSSNNFKVIRKFNQKYGGIILRLGKFTASTEYNFALNMSFLSNYPNEAEHLIYGGKFEIYDIICIKNEKNIGTHYNDIQSFKLYLQIVKGRWFSHNKLIFKKQYEKKLILFITNYLNQTQAELQGDNYNYMQLIFNNIVASNGSLKTNKMVYINKECDKLLPQLKKIIVNKLVPYLYSLKFKKGYNKILILKLNFNTINNSNFNKSLYSVEYKYSLLYLKNNRPQEIIFHFRCYKKYDDKSKRAFFKGCFEIKHLPKCVSKCKIIGGILLPQIQFEKWDFITLSHQKLYSGSSLFDIQKIKNLDSVLIKIAFQIKEVTDIDEKIIPTIDL